ncbi:MAG: FKBP-type peptidyl-prolyl cis-trans isomerase SlyD [Pseudohongiellaceae bacterium]|jgi:FKBP-type peptidyl-prolyl cis-trans isomerase SlyD
MTDKETPMSQTQVDTLGITKSTVVSFNYRMYEVLENGDNSQCLEDSYLGEPIVYLHGYRNIISGLEAAFEGKTSGDSFNASLDPISAYGLRKEGSIKRVPLKHLQFHQTPKKLIPGMIAGVKTEQGMRNVIVVKPGKFNADVDFNHPLAGKNLQYEIEVLSVREATAEEIAHRHVHGAGGHHH